MTDTRIRIHIDGSQAAVTFESPAGINVLSASLLHTIGAEAGRLGADRSIRTAVFQAEGKVFLAGADIKEMADFVSDQAYDYALLGQGVFDDIASMPCVTVAAINGAAMGGGLELAMACDFRVAVKSAKLAMPEVTLGLIPGWGGIGRLSRLIGPSRAKRLLLSGTTISAEEGHHLGLVDEVVNSVEDLRSRVNVFCKGFHKASPAAVRLAKRAARDGDDTRAFVDCFRERDSREGMAAFLEKRPASWVE